MVFRAPCEINANQSLAIILAFYRVESYGWILTEFAYQLPTSFPVGDNRTQEGVHSLPFGFCENW
jgi:hypothetical protein